MTKQKKPKIIKAHTIYDGSLLIFFQYGGRKDAEAEILTCDTVNGDYTSIGHTTRESLRVREPGKAEYVKIIVKNEEGVFITEPVKIEHGTK